MHAWNVYLWQHRSERISCRSRHACRGEDPERGDIPLSCTVSPETFDTQGLLLLSLLLKQRSFGCLCGQYSDPSPPALELYTNNRALAETCAVDSHRLKQ